MIDYVDTGLLNGIDLRHTMAAMGAGTGCADLRSGWGARNGWSAD